MDIKPCRQNTIHSEVKIIVDSEMMEKAAGVGIIGILAALRSWLGWLVLLYAGTMVLDYVAGTALAIKNHAWSSSRARQGLWHKCGSILTVGVATLTDILLGLILNNIPHLQLPFSYSNLLCPVVVTWYVVSELGSILENAAEMGAPIPNFMKTVLEKVTKECEGTAEAAQKKSVQK